MSRTVRLKLNEDDFRDLVSWNTAERSNSNCDVEIILADIWYQRMIDIINKLMNKNI